MSYSELKKFYDKTRLDYFMMAITHLMDIGWRNAKKITDEEIEKCEGNGLMTKGFVQWVQRTARDITQIADGPAELIQFCEAQDVFDIQNYAETVNRSTLEQVVQNTQEYLFNKGYNYDDMRYIWDLDDYEMELLGFVNEDDEDELETS